MALKLTRLINARSRLICHCCLNPCLAKTSFVILILRIKVSYVLTRLSLAADCFAIADPRRLYSADDILFAAMMFRLCGARQRLSCRRAPELLADLG